MKAIDIPPVWLALACLAAWAIGRRDPLALSFGGPWASFAAGILIGGGIILMVLAVAELRRARTTMIPHRDPARLVTSGIFGRSRNPIYLGDSLVLLGVILLCDAPLALPLLPVFVWIVERRFILPEEDRMRRKFRQEWARYEQKVRRWL